MKYQFLVPFAILLIICVCLREISYKKSFILGKTTHQEQIFAEEQQPGIPIRLQIPDIDLDTTIQRVGVTEEGAMAVPSNAHQVGWFTESARPGGDGSAVLAGHLNGEKGEPGVFANLHKLKAGDKLYLQSDNEVPLIFIVQTSGSYTPGYANEVFGSESGSHLNLITCEGEWDVTTKSYSKRFVVFADLFQQ